MSHWAYYAVAALTSALYIYSADHTFLIGAALCAIYGTGERIINHLKKAETSA